MSAWLEGNTCKMVERVEMVWHACACFGCAGGRPFRLGNAVLVNLGNAIAATPIALLGRRPTLPQGLNGGVGAAGLLSSSLQGMTTVTAFNMQEKLAEDYKQASEVMMRGARTAVSACTLASNTEEQDRFLKKRRRWRPMSARKMIESVLT